MSTVANRIYHDEVTVKKRRVSKAFFSKNASNGKDKSPTLSITRKELESTLVFLAKKKY